MSVPVGNIIEIKNMVPNYKEPTTKVRSAQRSLKPTSLFAK